MEDLTTNWDICCLCQEKSKEKLRYVSNIRSDQIHHLNELAENIEHFHRLGALPIPMNPKRLDNGTGIVNTFFDNNACYHLSCKLSLNNDKLERAKGKSRKHKIEIMPEATRPKRKCIKKNMCLFYM